MAGVDEGGKHPPERALLDPTRGVALAQDLPRRCADEVVGKEMSQCGPLSTLDSGVTQTAVALQSQRIQPTALSLLSGTARGRKRLFSSIDESDSMHELDVVACDVELAMVTVNSSIDSASKAEAEARLVAEDAAATARLRDLQADGTERLLVSAREFLRDVEIMRTAEAQEAVKARVSADAAECELKSASAALYMAKRDGVRDAVAVIEDCAAALTPKNVEDQADVVDEHMAKQFVETMLSALKGFFLARVC